MLSKRGGGPAIAGLGLYSIREAKKIKWKSGLGNEKGPGQRLPDPFLVAPERHGTKR